MIDTSAILTCERDLILPQTYRVELKVIGVLSFKSFDSRRHHSLVFEKDMSSETLAQLCELFDKTSIVFRDDYEDFDRYLLWILEKRLYFLLQSLLKA